MVDGRGQGLVNVGMDPSMLEVNTYSQRCKMIRVIVISGLIALLSLGTGVVGWTADDDGSMITIVSPAKGAVIKGDSIEVRYRVNDRQATHIHCYVDGEYQRGFKGVLKGLTRGPHEIKIVAANQDHEGLVAEAVVRIEVE